MSIRLKCSCGKSLRCDEKFAGKKVKCPKCNGPLLIPHPPATPTPPVTMAKAIVNPSPTTNRSRPNYSTERNPTNIRLTLQSYTIGKLITTILVAGGGVAIMCLLSGVVALMIKSHIIGALLFLAAMPVVLLSAISFFSLVSGKKAALATGDGHALFGFVHIIAWDPDVGILVLKDKMVSFVDSNPEDGGGIEMLVPNLGEEVLFRAPLKERTTKFTDEEVLTREMVPFTVKGAISWRLFDLEKFYTLVSSKVHEVSDRGKHKVVQGYDETDVITPDSLKAGIPSQLEAGEEWLRLVAEEQTRKVFSQVQAGLLDPSLNKSAESHSEASNGLADSIESRLYELGLEYGIYVQRVHIQEAKPDKVILEEATLAAKSTYAPAIAKGEANADIIRGQAEAINRKNMLQGEADVLGANVVGMKEVLSNAPDPPLLGGGGDQMIGLLGNMMNTPGGGPPVANPAISNDEPAKIVSNTDNSPITEDAELDFFADDEETAKQMLLAAKKCFKAGEKDNSITQLEKLIASYPSTTVVQAAKKNLEKLRSMS